MAWHGMSYSHALPPAQALQRRRSSSRVVLLKRSMHQHHQTRSARFQREPRTYPVLGEQGAFATSGGQGFKAGDSGDELAKGAVGDEEAAGDEEGHVNEARVTVQQEKSVWEAMAAGATVAEVVAPKYNPDPKCNPNSNITVSLS